MNEQEIYIQFKLNIKKTIGESVILNDIANISCPLEIKDMVENILILPEVAMQDYVLSSIEIIDIVKRQVPQATINIIGQSDVLIEVEKASNNNTKPIVTWLKVALTTILLFVGAGLAIMYFHADVNMDIVHQTIYRLVTGKQTKRPLIISIPYSIGLGIGIAVFFDVFSIHQKKQKPGPLELELYKYDQDVSSYKTDKGSEGNT
ncbi:MAG: stage V sporulation protein AA [Xylanivirga thermophila]|jgi:stage V sporulation protein AA|uniref:stage V sporulation protein AA n=1 Tax=Xylanivirga thermophila TaxID=2496273 RepID=UPI0013EA54AB|nr:stage V sporulation protein AA [Xylanivirga thermophila]